MIFQEAAMMGVCNEFWPCNALPAELHFALALIIPLTALILVAVPIARILHRAGRSGWWTILAFVPLLNLIFMWVFAFSRWPAVDRKVGA
jgi:uncharacterized membrane protein YhaH (DUF805 family)